MSFWRASFIFAFSLGKYWTSSIRFSIGHSEGLTHPRAITGVAFLLEDDGWTPWLPGADHPLHERFNLLRLQSLGEDYSSQEKLLNAINQKAGTDIWVASYSVVKNNHTGHHHSYCVWSQGVDTLLPKTDEVFFFLPHGKQEGDVVAKADWHRVRRVVGNLMESQVTYPERFRVKAFPTTEQLRLLGED